MTIKLPVRYEQDATIRDADDLVVLEVVIRENEGVMDLDERGEAIADALNATVPAPDLTAALARWKAAYEEWEWQQHPGRYRLDMTVAALEEASEALYGILKDGTP